MTNVSSDTWRNVIKDMTNADWSFSSRARSTEFHPYPARFIPEIPRQVISIVQPVGTVMDPFCGSGTTLLEARRAGLDAVGGDINPIACLISRVRTCKYQPNELLAAEGLANELYLAASRSTSIQTNHAEIPRLTHWFNEVAQRAMSGASSVLTNLDVSPHLHDLVAVSISAATVRISNQESDTRYAAVPQIRDQLQAAEILRESVLRTIAWVRENVGEIAPDAKVTVVEADAQDMSYCADDSIGLVCFSPPYPNAYEYWLYHKYRMYWLGFDPISVREAEIGARPHYSRPNGLTEEDFKGQMINVYGEITRVLRTDAAAVAVVGDSFIGGRQIDNGDLLAASAEAAGLEVSAVITRPVAENRSSFNRAHSRGRKSEHIVVARKTG